jgi:hypothetical protein
MLMVRPPKPLDHQHRQQHHKTTNSSYQLSNPQLKFEKTIHTSITMHATSLFATIVALSAAVSATPLFPRANRKANEFVSGDW